MEDLKQLKTLTEDLTILYVEDDTDIAKTIINYLSKFFKEVLYAQNGEDGLTLYKQQPCDLVITDIQMPKMHGLDMTYEIKKINPHQNVVIISAYSEIENFLSSIKLGVDGYIIKPVDYNEMNQLLYKMANRIQTFKNNELYLNRVNTLIEELSCRNNELKHYTDALNKVALVTKCNQNKLITFANDFFCDISGYTKEELLGQPLNIINHPDTDLSVVNEVWDTLEQGQTWEGDFKNITKEGQPFYVHASAIPLFETEEEQPTEYIFIRFLTTSNETEKREFKKKVMLNYQEFRKENYQYKKRIEELETQLLEIKNEDIYLKKSSIEHKSKHSQLLSQIKFYEKEIQKINEHHAKILTMNNENNKKMAESYKKALQQFDKQKNKIERLSAENAIKEKEIIKLETEIQDQRKIITDLKQTIKNSIEKEEESKKGLLNKLL